MRARVPSLGCAFFGVLLDHKKEQNFSSMISITSKGGVRHLDGAPLRHLDGARRAFIGQICAIFVLVFRRKKGNGDQ